MADNIYDLSINDFLKQAMSPTPTPGGANVSAVAATLACSMVSMVATLTIGKAAYAAVQEPAQDVARQCVHIIEILKELTHQDIAAFNDYMTAYRLPKTDAAAQATRSATLAAAACSATLVPMDIGRACLKIIRLAYEMADFGAQMAVSDAGVGACLSLGALRSAMLSVEVNLQNIVDQDFIDQCQKQCAEMLTQADKLCSATLVKTRERMG